MADKLDMLIRTDGASEPDVKPENSKKYRFSKRTITCICRTLTFETNKYLPEKTVENIENYLKTKDKMTRILYSEISNFMFNLETRQRVVFLTNVEKLLIYSLDETVDITEDAAKIIVKIYDHIQLVNYQIENMNNIFVQRITDTKIDLHREIKGVEKEYISILGIFAAIVLAFVGGITFSSSVLQNIDSVSVYRLLLVVVILAFVLVNVIWLLVKFIAQINDKDIKIFKIGLFDTLCIVAVLIIVLAWILNAKSIAGFVSDYLPWCQ